MPPDLGSMQSSPDSILASLQPGSQECTREPILQSIGPEGEAGEGEFVTTLSEYRYQLVGITTF